MRSTIVVGVTDSPASSRAVDWAVDRAAHRDERLELVSIVGVARGVIGERGVVDDALERTGSLLDREAERVRASGVFVDTRIARGKPVEQLIEASKDAALLVIGSDHQGPGSGRARGAQGVRITAGARCPVAVVPDIDVTGRSGVVVGVDGSELSNAAIAFAASEAHRSGEELIAVSAWSPVPLPYRMRSYPASYLEGMQTSTEETLAIDIAHVGREYPDLIVRRVVERGYPEAVINLLAEHARLTVVGSHGRSGIGRFLLGSTSQQILAHLAAPTVVVR